MGSYPALRDPALHTQGMRAAFSNYFTPESCLFFVYSARSAALTWPMSGPALTVLVAAAGAFGVIAWLLAKAAEVETARIARPTRMIFFMFGSLEKDAQQSTTNLG